MKKLMTIIFFAITLSVSAQQIVPSVGIGYGTFNMKSMKAFQQTLAKEGFPVKPDIVDEFPAFVNYWGAISIQYDDVSLDFVAGHTSTGGRIYYEDYTGYIGADNLVSMTYAGLTPGLVIPAGKFKICPGANIFYYFNKLDIHTFGKIGTETDDDHSRFKSQTLTLGPSLELRREFGRFIIQGNVSYNFPVYAGKLYFEDDHDAYLLNSDDNPVTIGGNALRAGLSIGVVIGKSRGDLIYHRVTRVPD